MIEVNKRIINLLWWVAMLVIGLFNVTKITGAVALIIQVLCIVVFLISIIVELYMLVKENEVKTT